MHKNDMAGEEPDSWKSILEKEGFQVTVQLDGLGSFPETGQLFALPSGQSGNRFKRQFHTVNRNPREVGRKSRAKYVTVTAGLPTCCLYFTALKCKTKLEHTQVFFCMSFSVKRK